jgi:formate hydrogenlyase subunit 4
LMGSVSGLVAQVLHIALIGVAAPSLIGIYRWMQARLAGRVGAPPLQPWWDLIRLLRKERLLAESASDVTGIAPAVSAAATAVAACLVPSFALGMTFAPFADLLLIAGLLALARCCTALLAMDAGTAPAGVGAARSMLLACLAEPALLLVLFVLALLSGSLNLDVISAMQLENGGGSRVGVWIALAATLLVALVGIMRCEMLAHEFGGPDLALLEATDAMRLLVWFNLIGAMFLPFGMAPSAEGPIAWAVGIACWMIRTVVFAGVLALLHAVLGRIRLQREAQVLGVAVLLGLLAAIFLFAGMGTA